MTGVASVAQALAVDVAGSGAALAVYPPPDLGAFIPEAHWQLYRSVLQRLDELGVRFALGGGVAMFFYTGMWRPTKDIDLYVLPDQSNLAISATRHVGFGDYFDEQPYDRNWIYRATRDGLIVDVIWSLANHSGDVDERWVAGGPAVDMGGVSVRLVPPEEMIWSKAHVIQRDRCDWPDVLNLLYTNGPALDWDQLLARLAEDWRVLASILLFFTWIAPGRAAQVPADVWHRLHIPAPNLARAVREEERIERIDSRPWFTDAELK